MPGLPNLPDPPSNWNSSLSDRRRETSRVLRANDSHSGLFQSPEERGDMLSSDDDEDVRHYLFGSAWREDDGEEEEEEEEEEGQLDPQTTNTPWNESPFILGTEEQGNGASAEPTIGWERYLGEDPDHHYPYWQNLPGALSPDEVRRIEQTGHSLPPDEPLMNFQREHATDEEEGEESRRTITTHHRGSLIPLDVLNSLQNMGRIGDEDEEEEEDVSVRNHHRTRSVSDESSTRSRSSSGAPLTRRPRVRSFHFDDSNLLDGRDHGDEDNDDDGERGEQREQRQLLYNLLTLSTLLDMEGPVGGDGEEMSIDPWVLTSGANARRRRGRGYWRRASPEHDSEEDSSQPKDQSNTGNGQGMTSKEKREREYRRRRGLLPLADRIR